MSATAAATKNGHPLLVNGTGFENGSKVLAGAFDFDEADREFAEQQREIGRREVMVDKYVIIRRVFDWVFKDSNVELCADAFHFVTGTTATSEVEIGAKYGLTKAAVSKRVKKWQELLGLPPSAAMRSDKACETFKQKTIKSWKRRLNPLRKPGVGPVTTPQPQPPAAHQHVLQLLKLPLRPSPDK